MKPLEGLLVVEFCQYLSGPLAGLRLADLGARVVKIERPLVGDGGRQIATNNIFIEGDSLIFHTINRNKQSYKANLKDPDDLGKVKRLLEKADVLTHNFRPGIMEKLGLGFEHVKAINPALIYASVSGYGEKGAWAKRPGQDLLAQSVSGLTFLSGNREDNPTPFGIAVADIIAGNHLVQGILAALVKRGKTHEGSKVEVSLLESLIDFQFEVITTYLSDGRTPPKRAKRRNAHAYLGAPYGIYATKDGYIALAMGAINNLANVLDFKELLKYSDPQSWFGNRDEIMEIIAEHLIKGTTSEWLSVLEPANIWCSDVYDYSRLLTSEAYKTLQMDQETVLHNGKKVKTTRFPITIDGEKYFSPKAAPGIGEDNTAIDQEFNKNI